MSRFIDRSVINRIRIEQVLASSEDRRLEFRYDIGRRRLSYVVVRLDEYHFDDLDEAIDFYNGDGE